MRYLSFAAGELLKNKTVLLRIDCDVDVKDEGGRLIVDEDYRLRCVLPTINFLLDHGISKIVMIGHIGRPEGKAVEGLRLEPIARRFRECLNSAMCPPKGRAVAVQSAKLQCKVKSYDGYEISDKIILLENVRFDKREEENDGGFARELASLGDIYVNEAFGVSHRAHASTVGLPKYLPSYYGLQFEKEIERLTWLKEKAPRPLVFVLGGSKEDKLGYLEFLAGWADEVLVGGKLPLLVQSSKFKVQSRVNNSKLSTNCLVHNIAVSQYPSIKLAELTPSGLDIMKESIELFKQIISTAKTVVWAGPMGKYEEVGNEVGTYEIAKAVANCAGIKFAGGGDTHRIISRLNLWGKFDFVSVGGGAMLRLLRKTNTYS